MGFAEAQAKFEQNLQLSFGRRRGRVSAAGEGPANDAGNEETPRRGRTLRRVGRRGRVGELVTVAFRFVGFEHFGKPCGVVAKRTDMVPTDPRIAAGCGLVFDHLPNGFGETQGVGVGGNVGVFESLVSVHCLSFSLNGRRPAALVAPPAGVESRLAIAAGLPSPFAAVADLAAFNDVDRRVFGDVLVVKEFAGVFFARFVHLRAACYAGDPIFKGPVFLRHQPHVRVVAVSFAVVFQKLHQIADRHVCLSVGVNEKSSCDDDMEPWKAKRSKRIRPASRMFFGCFSRSLTWPKHGPCRDDCIGPRLPLTYPVHATNGERCGHKTKKRRGLNRGVDVVADRRSDRPVVLAGQVEKFLFDRAEIASGLAAGQFTEAFVAKRSLVPTLRPTESVEQSVEFRFAVASVGSVPARFGAGLFGVVPTRTSFLVQGEFGQAQDHLDVADQFGFVERSGEGPNFDPLPAAGEVRQVEEMVAVGFAANLCRFLRAVGFDLFGPLVPFAASRAGRSVDGFFVVGDQRDQAGERGRVAVP